MGKKCIIEFEDKPFHKDGDFLYRVKGFNSLVFDMTGIGKLTPYNEPDLERVREDAYLKGLNDGQGVILESTQNNAFNNGYKKCLEDMGHDKGKENSIGYKIGYKKGYIDGLNRISDYEDKIRKEAYEDGYKTAKVQCNIQAEKDLREVGERHYKKGLSDAWDAARKICTNWVLPDSVLSKIFGMDKTIDDIMKENKASEAIEKIRAYEQAQKEKEEQIQVGDEVATDAGNRASVLYENPDGTQVFVFKSDGTAAWWTKSALHRTGRNFFEIATVLKKMRGEQDG